MSDLDQQLDTGSVMPAGDPDCARHCVACGYNLFGLGDEPRCPECGLLNIPEEFRREVWALVDSGKWFFSGFLSPFKKRPHGWWWALDRPGDVRRSIKFAAMCVAASFLIVFASFAIVGATVSVRTGSRSFVDPSGTVRPAGTWVVVIDGFGIRERVLNDRRGGYDRGRSSVMVNNAFHAALEPTFKFVWPFAITYALIFFLWAGPALAGLWTQIRKGLPEFAKAPRTIIAASNYEAHRLLYLAAIVLVLAIVDSLSREELCSWYMSNPLGVTTRSWMPLLALALLAMYGAAGWVGPLRTDYTKQLVRSRFHAIRIILMYAVALPALAAIAVAAIRDPVFW